MPDHAIPHPLWEHLNQLDTEAATEYLDDVLQAFNDPLPADQLIPFIEHFTAKLVLGWEPQLASHDDDMRMDQIAALLGIVLMLLPIEEKLAQRHVSYYIWDKLLNMPNLHSERLSHYFSEAAYRLAAFDFETAWQLSCQLADRDIQSEAMAAALFPLVETDPGKAFEMALDLRTDEQKRRLLTKSIGNIAMTNIAKAHELASSLVDITTRKESLAVVAFESRIQNSNQSIELPPSQLEAMSYEVLRRLAVRLTSVDSLRAGKFARYLLSDGCHQMLPDAPLYFFFWVVRAIGLHLVEHGEIEEVLQLAIHIYSRDYEVLMSRVRLNHLRETTPEAAKAYMTDEKFGIALEIAKALLTHGENRASIIPIEALRHAEMCEDVESKFSQYARLVRTIALFDHVQAQHVLEKAHQLFEAFDDYVRMSHLSELINAYHFVDLEKGMALAHAVRQKYRNFYAHQLEAGSWTLAHRGEFCKALSWLKTDQDIQYIRTLEMIRTDFDQYYPVADGEIPTSITVLRTALNVIAAKRPSWRTVLELIS